MDLKLEGKTAMVAAASKGIGLAVAQALAAEGCKLSICSHNEDNLTEASHQINGTVETYLVDVANVEDLKWWAAQTKEDLGPVSILVTNTGGPPAGLPSETTDEQWEQGFQSTLMNIVRLVREVSPMMAEAQWGRIVHISSLVAKEPVGILAISSTLRTGLRSLTKLQAQELGPSQITVNSVLPGHTLTDRQRHLAEIRAEREQITVDDALDLAAKLSPLGRLGKPEEIAAAVTFLCSEHAGFITGESILIDGAAVKSAG